jgi:hypothetical protein
VNAGFFYKSSEEREKLVSAERDFIEKRVQKVIDLKKKLCDNTDKRFVVINQKVRCSIAYCSLDLQHGCEEAAGVLKYMHCIRVTYFHLCVMDITKCCFISCRKKYSHIALPMLLATLPVLCLGQCLFITIIFTVIVVNCLHSWITNCMQSSLNSLLLPQPHFHLLPLSKTLKC